MENHKDTKTQRHKVFNYGQLAGSDMMGINLLLPRGTESKMGNRQYT
jgi:hypothetical protein